MNCAATTPANLAQRPLTAAAAMLATTAYSTVLTCVLALLGTTKTGMSPVRLVIPPASPARMA